MIPWHGGKKMKLDAINGAFGEAEYLVRQAQERAMAGDHTTAINYLMKAIDKNPGYPEAYTLLGNCQDCLDRKEDAIASYDKALQIDPSHADAWFNKGMSLKKLGKTKEATQCIEKSIDLYCGR
ncbi:MAG: tetratricopeptide repeat protein [Methanoregula sp.]|jgi:tetratricopeptide (TPR) repeat protein|nr:tetratricopeptide repeat protein [Methanoregula sp.]